MEIIDNKRIKALNPTDEYVTIRITRKAWNRYSGVHLSEQYEVINVVGASLDEVYDTVKKAITQKELKKILLTKEQIRLIVDEVIVRLKEK